MIREVEKNLNSRISKLEAELRENLSLDPLFAMRERNDRRARSGAVRLKAELRRQQELGVIDDQGRRIRKGWPERKLERGSDVV